MAGVRNKISQPLLVEALEERTVPTLVFQPHYPGVAVTSVASARSWSLQSAPVVLTFAGSYWATAAGQADEQTLIAGAKSVIGSAYLSGLVQYGSDGKASYFGAWTDSQKVALTGNEPTGTSLLNYAQRETSLHQGQLPPTSTNLQKKPIYFVINDPADAGPGQSVWGENSSNTHLYAGYVGARFLTIGGINVDSFTEVFSHELAEGMVPFIAVSDPGHIGWGSQIADNEPELADYSVRVNGVMVQAYWSAQDKGWIVPDGSTTRTIETPIWNGNIFTGTYNLVSTLSKPQAGTIAQAVAGRNSLFVLTTGGMVWQHTGANPNSGWLEVWGQGASALSAGVDASGQDTVFVNLSGALWEHTGTSMNTGWSQIWASGVTAFSASQVQANTVFVSFGGDLWQHVGLSSGSGWTQLARSGVTSFDAGVDGAYKPAVFVNLGGQVWEHTGTDPNAGWWEVWTDSVEQMRASQAQANTVFISFGTDLWEHTGTDRNTGWAQVLASGVTAFSAGVDAPGNASVFVTLGGELREHAGMDMNSGWSEIQTSGVTGISASQFKADNIFVNLVPALWQHVGTNARLGWLQVV